MIKKVFLTLAVIVFTLASFSHLTAHAATALNNFDLTSDSYAPGAVATYTFTYDTFLDLPNPGDAVFFANFPAGFDVASATVTVMVNSTVPAIASYVFDPGTNSVKIILDQAVTAGSHVTAEFAYVGNPHTPGSYDFTGISTLNDLGNPLDRGPNPFTVNIVGTFAGGDGSADDPYQISTCQQLQNITQSLDKHFILTADIDCTESSTWNANTAEWQDGIVGGTLIPDSYDIVTNNGYSGFRPIGDYNNPFTGTIDGNDHKISHLWVFRKVDSYTGMISRLDGGHIQDLGIENSNIVGGTNTGMFVGYMSTGTISNVTNDTGMVRAYLSTGGGGIVGAMDGGTVDYAIVKDGYVHGSGNVIGGITGYMSNGSIAHSHSSADTDGGEYIGGFVGQMSGGTITDSYATGDVVSNSVENTIQPGFIKNGTYSGGFVAYMSGGSISGSYATGSVTAEGDYAGGFVGGFQYGGTITTSYATGQVHGEKNYVGGFAGEIGGGGASVSDSYATGAVTGDQLYTGGFAGMTDCQVTITRAYATGNVNGHEYTGGFSGFDGCEGPGATIHESFATGSVDGSQYVGGFIGLSSLTTVINAYASGNVSGSGDVGGFIGRVSGSTLTHVYSRGSAMAGNIAGAFIGVTESAPTITDSFFDSESGNAPDWGYTIGKTTAEMKTTTTYTDVSWDFVEVWARQTGINSGYPYFQYQNLTPEDTTPPVLTLISQPARNTTSANATWTFRTSETCNIDALPLSVVPASAAAVYFDAPQPDVDVAGYISPLVSGSTYTVSFRCIDAANNESNEITIGPFTIDAGGAVPVQTIYTSGGGQYTYVPSVASSVGSTSDQPTLPTDCQPGMAFSPSTGKPCTTTSTPTDKKPFLKDLRKGMDDPDVARLQHYLALAGFPVASTGYGSLGNEVTTYGAKTAAAVAKFQKAKAITPASGFFGPKTRKYVNDHL